MLIREITEKNVIDFGIQNKIYNLFYIIYNYLIFTLHQKNI